MGGFADAAIRGAYTDITLELWRGSRDRFGRAGGLEGRDIDLVAPQGNTQLPEAAFGLHHIDTTPQVLLSGRDNFMNMMGHPRPLSAAIANFPVEALGRFIRRTADGVEIPTFSLGVYAILTTLMPASDEKYLASRVRILNFAQRMRLRADVPAEEFPSDRVVEELQKLAW